MNADKPRKPEETPDLRTRAEGVLSSLAPAAGRGVDGNGGPLVHELRVHQIELEMQNENLRELTLELQAARDRYADLYEFAPVGYLTLDADWWIRRVNRAATRLLGRDPQGLLGRPLSSFVVPESQDDFFLLKRHAVSTTEPVERELAILRNGSEHAWILLHAASYQTAAGAQEYRIAMADVTARVRAQEELSDYRKHLESVVETRTVALTQALREKETLLREIQHRVKNNLQFVSSLLSLEAGAQRSVRGRTAFHESQLRVEAMALVHRLLHLSFSSGTVSGAEYVKELSDGLMSAYSVRPGRVTLVTEVEDIPLNLDTAVPIGLILNELITNALTHAFAGGTEGTLRIVLSREDAGRYYLAVVDNGRGMPAEVDLEAPSTVGLTLVTLLAKQLGGSSEWRRDGGTTFVVRFADAASSPPPEVNNG